MAKCKYCGKEITWLKEGRRNIPVEGDGATHECEEYKRSKNSYRQVSVAELDPEILKQYQESINSKTKAKK